MDRTQISRRSFLKMAALGVGSLALRPRWLDVLRPLAQTDFPQAEHLGRVAVGMVELKSRPDQDSETVGSLYEDAVVACLREVVGRKPYYINQRWVETSQGFIYGPYLQPVRNMPNQPVSELRQTNIGVGLWVEVTVPYVDIALVREPSSHSWLSSKIEEGLPPRLYYGQTFWVDQIRQNEGGQIQYRVNPNFYGGVDMVWAAAEAFRPVPPEEFAPISPEIENKRIVVDVNRQQLSCYENDREIYFCRVSTGAKFDASGNPVDKWSTPVGKHKISRKYVALQMSGGTTGAGYDLPGIGWVCIFVTGGVAVHSTFWHNDYGVPRSHGCVNVRPEDAKWIFRWTAPHVSYETGMVDISLTGEASTIVEVIES